MALGGNAISKREERGVAGGNEPRGSGSLSCRWLFAAGSMGPKVLADVRFAENGEKNAIIASLERTWQALQGDSGTKITS